jgi:hypothetical protein
MVNNQTQNFKLANLYTVPKSLFTLTVVYVKGKQFDDRQGRRDESRRKERPSPPYFEATINYCGINSSCMITQILPLLCSRLGRAFDSSFVENRLSSTEN